MAYKFRFVQLSYFSQEMILPVINEFIDVEERVTKISIDLVVVHCRKGIIKRIRDTAVANPNS